MRIATASTHPRRHDLRPALVPLLLLLLGAFMPAPAPPSDADNRPAVAASEARALYGPRRRHHDEGLFGVPFSAAFAPLLTVTMTDQIIGDDGDGEADPGETIRYTVVIANDPLATDATNVVFTDTVAPNTTLVPGSDNASPLAFDASATVPPTTTQTLMLSGADADGDALTFSIVTPPTQGTLGPITQTSPTSAEVDYTASASPSGPTDSFTYRVNDGTVDSNEDATVTLTLDAAPAVTGTTPADAATDVSVATTITIDFNEPVDVTAAGVTLECPSGSAVAFSGLPATNTSQVVLTPSANLPGGETCAVNVVVAEVTDADPGDPPDQMGADFPFSFGVAPVANDDPFTATGNLGLEISAAGVLANDEGAGLSVSEVQGNPSNVGVATATTATGLGGITGFVTLLADGSFTYAPPPGFTGDDTFTYRVTSTAGTSNTATVTVTLSQMVWFIDGSAGGPANRGTFADPFLSIADFNAAQGAAAPNPKPGDVVYLYEGTYIDGLTLQAGQQVYGDAVDLTTVFTADADSPSAYDDGLEPRAVNVAGDARPVIDLNGPLMASRSRGGVRRITALGVNDGTLGTNNTVRGLDVTDTPGGFGMVDGGGSVGTLLVSEVSISGSGGALQLSAGGDVSGVTFDVLSSTSAPGAALSLSNVAGTMTPRRTTAGRSPSRWCSPTPGRARPPRP